MNLPPRKAPLTESADNESPDSGPERRCIASGVTGAPSDMVRFVIDPEGAVVPDVAGRLPGRGMWVTADRDLLAQAVAKNAFARSAKGKARVAPDLVAVTEGALTRRVTELLGLARRAGLLVTGFEKVRAIAERGGAAVVVTAADGAANGRAKVEGLARGLPLVTWLASAELSFALGGENVVHAALAPGPLTDLFLNEARRLRGLRGVAGGVGTPPDLPSGAVEQGAEITGAIGQA